EGSARSEENPYDSQWSCIATFHSITSSARASSVSLGCSRPLFADVFHSFDPLVGEREQLLGSLQAERLGCFQIDHQLEFGRRLHREGGRRGTLEKAGGI